MYICTMSNDNRILQKTIVVNPEDGNHMILVFVKDKIVVATITIPFPCWHQFYDENFRYYPKCLN
jgi:hypothetical protein